jgi:hypothetical protein
MAENVHLSLNALLSDQSATLLAKATTAYALYYLSIDPTHRPDLMAANVHISLRDFLNTPDAFVARERAASALANLEERANCCTIS